MEINIRKICRICLCSITNQETISIYDSYQDDIKIFTKLMDFSGIVVHENDEILPRSICLQCCENLNNSYQFRNLCRSTDEELKRSAYSIKIKPVRIAVVEKYENDVEIGIRGEEVEEQLEVIEIKPELFDEEIEKVEIKEETQEVNGEEDAVEINEENQRNNAENQGSSEESDGSEEEIEESNEKQASNEGHELDSAFELIPGSKNQYNCKVCKRKVIGKRFHLLRHVKCNMHLNKLKELSSSVSLKPTFICEYCGKQFDKKNSLTYHNLIHSSMTSFSCEICNKSFRLKLQVKRHMRVHSGERPFNCRFCEKNFRYSAAKIAHERTHTDERPFPCKFCKKRFRQQSTLKAHLQVHTGEKPYSCCICNLFFVKKYHQDRHYKTKSHQKILLEKGNLLDNQV